MRHTLPALNIGQLEQTQLDVHPCLKRGQSWACQFRAATERVAPNLDTDLFLTHSVCQIISTFQEQCGFF